jgi:hypothetical protein
VIFLDQLLGAVVYLVVQVGIGYLSNILYEVLPQAMRQSLNVILLSQVLHHEHSGLNALVVVV